MPHACIIGAGAVGLATARGLQKAGWDITLVDPAGPGTGASFGNAGLIAGSAVVPEARPDVLRGLPGMLLDRDGPLRVAPGHAPRMLRYGFHFARAAGDAERISKAMARLTLGAFDAWMRLLDDLPAARALFRRDGCLFVYLTESEREAAATANGFRRRRGMTLVELDAGQVAERAPALAIPVAGATLSTDSGNVLDPGALCSTLFDALCGDGATFVPNAATGIEPGPDRAGAVRLSDGASVAADVIVVAAGIDSDGLARQVGVFAPLHAERGYHVELRGRSNGLSLPMIVPSLGCGAAPMNHAIRVAGLVEFAGAGAPPSAAMRNRIDRRAEKLFGFRPPEDAARWMGRRPSLPDGLPIVDRAPAAPHVVLAYGHGQVGLTEAATTAEAIAALVSGSPLPFDLADYRADRFQRGRAA